jgi:hypothetical protein
MLSSGMLRPVALVGTDVSGDHGASMKVTRISELATNARCEEILCELVFLRSVRLLLVTANVVYSSQTLVTLVMETLSFSETSVLTRATRRNIPEDTILHVVSSLVRYSLTVKEGH